MRIDLKRKWWYRPEYETLFKLCSTHEHMSGTTINSIVNDCVAFIGSKRKIKKILKIVEFYDLHHVRSKLFTGKIRLIDAELESVRQSFQDVLKTTINLPWTAKEIIFTKIPIYALNLFNGQAILEERIKLLHRRRRLRNRSRLEIKDISRKRF